MSESESPKIPSYQRVSQLLKLLQPDASASADHGLLCGVLCTGNEASGVLADSILLSAEILDDEIDEDTTRTLLSLKQITTYQLSQIGFDLQLLLPGDDEPIELRTMELSNWCGGGLNGIGLGSNHGEIECTEEVYELLERLAEIANVELSFELDDEENETAYTEVVEFVRLAVLMIHAELRGEQPVTH